IHFLLVRNRRCTLIIQKRRFNGAFGSCNVGTAKKSVRSIARRWLALVERREQHLADLSQSGRWRRYYTQTEFLNEMRKVLQVRNQWAALAGVPVKPSDDARGRKAVAVSRPLPNAYRGRPALTLVSSSASVR